MENLRWSWARADARPGRKVLASGHERQAARGIHAAHCRGRSASNARSFLAPQNPPFRHSELFSLTSTLRGHISRATSLLRQARQAYRRARWLRNERLRRSRRRKLRARLQSEPPSERPPSAQRKARKKHLGKRRAKGSPREARARRQKSRRPPGLAVPPALPRPSLRRTRLRQQDRPLRRSGSTREKRNRAPFFSRMHVEQTGRRKIVRLFAFCGARLRFWLDADQ
jgi:hypothetical protein